jgi:CDGSH-type Zn-finger protein
METSDNPSTGNIAVPETDGPLALAGEIEIVGADGTTLARHTETALCRCGNSRNKPYCDGSHERMGFQDPGGLGHFANAVEQLPGGLVRITPRPNASLGIAGPLELRSADQSAVIRLEKASLCRCGASKNKPFCDGSHKVIGFQSEA